ncbi:dTDP-4-dehydrorhamnose reductase [Alkalibacterium putridalgicola]|uniref:dTDP-4-dehydrorhamnose reductase n=1 Tax=Alkalibacterium putridalgicola TaxID=426703 RepID=A0A1H7QMC0_9LACT|nr:dTDP-4-dehydrorhamnose reductase [Alkalibacterium putridalgicola]GEK88403.1 NAD(P)-dependent oxidoreductase [Alkalibacterium putridalgicola]SEL49271.1 dTDP-4-dehydrorhamnose reductase [Alkalibacterium putridalgicola]
MKALITGATGQLGQELQKYLTEIKVPYTAYGASEMDILDKDKVEKVISKDKPTVVFHCAAYTAVDKAEEETELNWVVNVEGTRHVAETCKNKDIPFVYISTDYVFDGKSEEMYKVDDQPNPINEYGKAKLAGEKVVQETLKKYYIIRTSWVFGEFGSNFVYTMKKLAKDRDELTIISDQIGRPTWTRTLSEFMIHLVETEQEYGTYHLSNEGTCSWYEFAKGILKDEAVAVKPIESKDYPQKAERPMHSVLDLSKSVKTGYDIPHWKKALSDILEKENNL